jgi:hypothetical protein
MTHPTRFWRIALLAVVFWSGTLSGQTTRLPGDPSTPTPTPTPATPKLENAAPDAPVPDLGTLPTKREKPKSVPQKISRKLRDAAPRCLDAIVHTCWSQPSAPEGPVANTLEEARYLKDIEVGDFYLETKNYSGAEMRFRDALTAKEKDLEATFKLAFAEEHSGKPDEARCSYKAYLQLDPDSPFATRAQRSLEKLKSGRDGERGCPAASQAKGSNQ